MSNKKGFKKHTTVDSKNSRKSNKVKEDIAKAVNLHKNGNLVQAEQIYKKLIEQKKHLFHPIILNNYATICKKKGQIKENIKLLQTCNELFPNYADAYSNLGLTLKQQGKDLLQKLPLFDLGNRKIVSMVVKFCFRQP